MAFRTGSGFLHEDRALWRLSPAFDINPSPEREREMKTWILKTLGFT
jgi:serine/threonine-protein kinase HipA